MVCFLGDLAGRSDRAALSIARQGQPEAAIRPLGAGPRPLAAAIFRGAERRERRESRPRDAALRPLHRAAHGPGTRSIRALSAAAGCAAARAGAPRTRSCRDAEGRPRRKRSGPENRPDRRLGRRRGGRAALVFWLQPCLWPCAAEGCDAVLPGLAGLPGHLRLPGHRFAVPVWLSPPGHLSDAGQRRRRCPPAALHRA